MLYAGMDIHKEFSHAVVKTEQGEVIKEGRISTNKKKIQRFFKEVGEEFEVAMEATGNYEFFYETLEGLASVVHLSNPYKTRVIAEEKVKTDKIDANALADLLRGNLLPTSYVPSKDIRDLRTIVRRRVRLAKKRTELKNQIKHELRRHNIDYSNRSIFKEDGIQFLKELSNPIIDSHLNIYKTVDEELNNMEDVVIKEGLEYEQVKLLNTIPGIGLYSATLIFAEIADIHRFTSEEKLFSYAGLVPTVHQSGKNTYYGRLSRERNKYLQWILVQAIQSHFRFCPESNISSFYRRLKKRKPNNVAKIAATRKLLQTIYHMLKNNHKFRVNG
ncbi:MAG: IS110 family transposase [Thermoplasmata archaeon]